MIISVDTEKAFDKFKTFSQRNILNELLIEGTFLNLIKGIYENPQLTSYSIVKDWTFSPS